MNIYSISIILLSLLLIIYILFNHYNDVELYDILPSNNGYFINKNEFSNIVNTSPYFERMSESDLHARNVFSKDEYKYLYIESFIEPHSISEHIKRKLIEHVKYANINLKSKFTLLYDIPWKFSFISDSIENGYPHTLSDIIIISPSLIEKSNSRRLIKTLIHEKMHIFQRIYIKWCDDVINKWGFTKVENKYPISINPRNNPDLNDNIYKYGNYIILQNYKNKYPNTIADSNVLIISETTGEQLSTEIFDNIIPSYVSQIEHPYEIMACMIPELLVDSIEPSLYFEYVLLEAINNI